MDWDIIIKPKKKFTAYSSKHENISFVFKIVMVLLKAFSDIKSLRSVFANNSWVFFIPHTTLYMHLRNYRAYCVLEYNLNNHTDMDQHLLQTGKDL